MSLGCVCPADRETLPVGSSSGQTAHSDPNPSPVLSSLHHQVPSLPLARPSTVSHFHQYSMSTSSVAIASTQNADFLSLFASPRNLAQKIPSSILRENSKEDEAFSTQATKSHFCNRNLGMFPNLRGYHLFLHTIYRQ
ncbi:unnamed protein product [Protopolystoma xenopodis]|uniref:Uncharacterized protein n=1 Tax=Protopolystoma xenopodis TaxID=117903 RepID=A0A448X5T5_9PLAT|nr:unnamed protein product [Protopolystoma xenopodis]